MDALTGAGIALLTFALTSAIQLWRDGVAEGRAIAREARIDKRSLRDAKLARLRKAFEPVLVAVGGLQTAAAQYLYSETGNPDSDSRAILDMSLTGINEARAQLWLEEGTQDVAAELERVFRGFQSVRREIGGRLAGRGGAGGADDLKKAFEDISAGAEKIRKLIDDHLRAVERSA